MTRTASPAVTADTITDDQLITIRDENIARPIWRTARVALGECCIPFTYHGLYAERVPFPNEEFAARSECARFWNRRAAVVLTADTITDDQIRALYDDGTISGVVLHIANRHYAATYADDDRVRREERGRCAEILNARARRAS